MEKTFSPPKIDGQEDDPFLVGFASIFRGKLAVSLREGNHFRNKDGPEGWQPGGPS